jgi:hypothetical protein
MYTLSVGQYPTVAVVTVLSKSHKKNGPCHHGLENEHLVVQGWQTHDTWKHILGMWHSPLYQILLLLPDQILYSVKNMCKYTRICLRGECI